MTIESNKVLQSEGKKAIVYDAYYNSSTSPKPVVIFCHGYKGFKDWGAWNLIAKSFANSGYFFLKFNFSHNGGTVDQPIDFPDLQTFANNNYSLELEDLNRVIDFITSNNDWTTEIDLKNISLIGHSRGGGIVLLKAEEDSRIKKVVSWASVSDFKARFQEESESFKQWQQTGITYVENGRTKQQMPHYIQFYNDFKANENRLTIKRAVQNLQIPQLIIHGNKDLSVSVNEALALHKWNPKSKLVSIEGADHVFGTNHPWTSNQLPDEMQKAVDLTIDFLI